MVWMVVALEALPSSGPFGPFAVYDRAPSLLQEPGFSLLWLLPSHGLMNYKGGHYQHPPTTTLQTPQIPSNRDHKAINRGGGSRYKQSQGPVQVGLPLWIDPHSLAIRAKLRREVSLVPGLLSQNLRTHTVYACVCTHVHTYTYVCIHDLRTLSLSPSQNVCVYIYIYTYVYIYMHTCRHIFQTYTQIDMHNAHTEGET